MVIRFHVGTNKNNPRYNFHVSTISPIPKSYTIVIKDPNWQRAMLDKDDILLTASSKALLQRIIASLLAEKSWLQNLLRELQSPLHSATIVYCDNVSAVYLSSYHVQHQHTKHIEIDIYFFRDRVATGQVRVLHVPSRYQYADTLTKGLPSALFDEFQTSLIVVCPPAPTVRGC
ncbi:ribonuclease H-like domain-containing protein [Tanacetum coccineum]